MQHSIIEKSDRSIVQLLFKDGACVSERRGSEVYRGIVAFENSYLWFPSGALAKEYSNKLTGACTYGLYGRYVLAISFCNGEKHNVNEAIDA